MTDPVSTPLDPNGLATALAAALAAATAAGNTTEIDLFTAAIAGLAHLAAQVNVLTSELEAAPPLGAQQFADLTTQNGDLTTQRDNMRAHIANLETTLDGTIADRDAVMALRDALQTKADGLQTQLDAVATAPTIAAVAAPQRRKIVAMDNPATADLLELIAAAGTIQLAFSDGHGDIAGVLPRNIGGDAWRVVVNGLALTMPNFLVTNASGTQADLVGYALFAGDEQIAWARRSDVLVLWPGQQMNLSNDVIFAG